MTGGGRPTDPVGTPAGRDRLHLDTAVLMAGTVLVGAGNYGFTLVLVWLLPSRQFSEIASVNAVLMVLSTAATAAVPWVVTRELVRTSDRVRRRQVSGMTLVVAAAAGAVGAGVLVGVSWPYATAGVQVFAVVTVMAVFVAQVGSGYLQGVRRFALLSGLAVVEVVLKVGLGAGLAGTAGATGALAGGAVGALVWAASGLWLARRDVGRPALRQGYPWHQMVGIGAVQLGVSALAMSDVIVGSVLDGRSPALAGYQAMLVFARVPLFLTSAMSSAVYPRLVGHDPGAERRQVVVRAVSMYAVLGAVVLAVVSTAPPELLRLVLPHRYVGDQHLLLPLAIAGAAAGASNLFTTFLQADSAFRAPAVVLLGSLPVVMVVEAVLVHPLADLAWASAGAQCVVAAVLVALTVRRHRGAGLVVRAAVGAATAAAGVAVLHQAATVPGLWLALVVVAGGGALVLARTHTTPPAGAGEGDGPHRTAGIVGRVRQPVRRMALSGVTRTMVRLQPLTPPPLWEAMVAARSLAGEGPVVAPPPAVPTLVLAPHPDDETIGCGGTVALLAQLGVRADVVFTTDGEASVAGPGMNGDATRACRRAEAVAACQLLGTNAPRMLSLPDTGLASCLDELTDALAEVVTELEPAVVLAPWLLDEHRDHRATAVALARALTACGRQPEVWGYEVWGALPVNRVVDVSRSWTAKVAALGVHRSGRPSFNLDAHLALGRWRSVFGMGGIGFAEAFFVLTTEAYVDLVDRCGPTLEEQ